VTICAYQRQCIFGEIIDGRMRLNQYGAVVADEWQKSSIIRREIKLDAWVVMPNHFHGIVVIKNTIQECDRTRANDNHVGANALKD
jgi:putative transposase